MMQTEPECHVLVDAEVRIERIVLEDHRDVALARLQIVDGLLVDDDVAGAHLLEPRQHSQCRRLAATGGTDEDHELTVGDAQVDVSTTVFESKRLLTCSKRISAMLKSPSLDAARHDTLNV